MAGRLHGLESLRGLIDAAGTARRHAYTQVLQTLGDRRYTRLQLQLDLWLESGADQTGAEIENPPWLRPIRAVACEFLHGRHRKMRKLAKRFVTLEDEQRHELRINAKKARYAAEFFRSLFPRRPAQKYARRLSAMQDCLGSMNDAVVGKRLVDELVAGDPRLAQANDILLGWHAARIAADLPRAAKISKKMAKTAAFWESD